MLQKEEFQLTLETIEPSIEALKGAIQGVCVCVCMLYMEAFIVKSIKFYLVADNVLPNKKKYTATKFCSVA